MPYLILFFIHLFSSAQPAAPGDFAVAVPVRTLLPATQRRSRRCAPPGPHRPGWGPRWMFKS